MAQFTLDADTAQPVPIKVGGPMPVEIPKLRTLGEKGTVDYLSQLKGLTETQREKGDAGTGLALASITLDDVLGPGAQALAEGKELVDRKKYAEALPLLDAAISASSGALHDAVYLKGLCLARLRRPEPALEALRPLASARLAPKLVTRVKMLRDEIRQHLMLPVMLENLLLTQTGRTDAAAARLRWLIDLDPDAGLYHFMLTGTYLTADRLDEAAEAAAQGIERCEGEDRERLAALGAQIDRRNLERRLEPARHHYRRGRNRRARAALQRVPAAFHDRPLWRTFNDYLTDLGGGLFGLVPGRGAREVEPRGAFADVDALHFFIAGDEIRQAKGLMSQGAFGSANPVLAKALGLAPHFPYAHYLAAICDYQALGTAFESGEAPPLDEAIDRMARARGHAEFAARDNEIDGTQELVQAIGQAHQALTAIRDQIAARLEEARRINEAIEEFRGIQQSAGDGISSPEQYRSIRDRMLQLQKRLPALKRQVGSDDGREALGQLVKAVDSNVQQLKTLGKSVEEAEKVKPLGEEFGAIMNKVKSGVRSRKQLDTIERELQRLREKVQHVRTSVESDQAREALDQLGGVINRHLGEIHDAKQPREPSAQVQQSIAEFKAIMGSLPARSRQDLEEILRRLMTLRGRVDGADGIGVSAVDRRHLKELREAIDTVFSQAAKALTK